MMMAVLVLGPTLFSHMMGDAKTKTETFVFPSMLCDDFVPVVCKTVEDGAPFSMIEWR